MINLIAKKVRCPKCKKLSRVKLQKAGAKTQYICIKCNQIVCQKEALRWRFLKAE